MSQLSESFATLISPVREYFTDPQDAKASASKELLQSVYRHNWQFYTNEAFENLAVWRTYLDKKGLYQYTRLLYNPFRRLVDFYAGRVYPGRLSLDGKPFPDGRNLAIPFSEDSDEQLIGAVAQIWQWSNYQVQKSLKVRFGAIAGSVGAEIIDDVPNGRVRFETIWPGFVDHDFLELDPVGNVTQYALEYRVAPQKKFGENNHDPEYLYRKEVTKDTVTTYKNDHTFHYPGNPSASFSHPYTFCPFVWYKHVDLGLKGGASVFRGDFAKLDELNSLATHSLDVTHKHMDPAVVFWGGGGMVPLTRTPEAQAEMAEQAGYDVQRDIMMWTGPQGGQMQAILGELNLEASLEVISNLVEEIEKGHPELTFYEKLREMSQVTGPGADALIGDSQAYYDEACSNYDTGEQRLYGMGAAIAGFRYAEAKGGWSEQTEQRKKFANFNLESYENDDLKLEIKPRPLINLTEEDQMAAQSRKLDLANKATGLMPIEERLKMAGEQDEVKRRALAQQLAREQGIEAGDNGR